MKEEIFKNCKVKFDFPFGSSVFNEDFISLYQETDTEMLPLSVGYSDICVLFKANLYDNKFLLIKTLDLLLKDDIDTGTITVNFLSKDGTVYYSRKYIGVSVKDNSYKNIFNNFNNFNDCVFGVSSFNLSMDVPVRFSCVSFEENIA